MVERKAPLRRRGRPICFHLPEYALWPAGLLQYEASESRFASLGLGLTRSQVERQNDRALAAGQLCLHGAAVHVPSSAGGAEISRAALWRRNGSHLFQRFSTRHRLARIGKIPAVHFVPPPPCPRAGLTGRRGKPLSIQGSAGNRLQ